jgi:arylsulfatase A-like enzyme
MTGSKRWGGCGLLWVFVSIGMAGCTDSGPQRADVAAFEESAQRTRARLAALRALAPGFEQDAALSALEPNRHNAPYYRFDERIGTARIEGAATPAPPPPRSLSFEFSDDDPIPLVPRDEGATEVQNGVIKLTHAKNGYLISGGELAIPRDEIGAIEIRLKVQTGTVAELSWSRLLLDEWDWSRERAIGTVRIDTIPDGRFHRYRIDAASALRQPAGMGDTVRTIFLRASDVSGDEVELDYVRFIPKREKYAALPCGRTYETIGAETRQALFCNTSLTARYNVLVPQTTPRLRFGVGVLSLKAPVRFLITVVVNGREKRIYGRTVLSTEEWEDAQLNLSRWAGREVELLFEVESEKDNVAFWSNPVLFGLPEKRFNIVLVLEDTLRADHLSTYRHIRETSPVKDALVRRGMVFERAFSQATKTRPSCPSLMTALYPTATGVWSLHERLDDRYLTLAEVLRSQGFATAAFVQNPNAGLAAGLHQGFGHFQDARSLGKRPRELYTGPALDWLESHSDRNVFVYLHAVDPHGKYDPPRPFDRWYRQLGPGATPVEPDTRRYRRLLDPPWLKTPTVEGRQLLYDGEILQNDYYFKALLEKLRRLGLLDDTLIVFVSDHGEHLGEHGVWGHKAPGFVQVLHVPLLMAYPRQLTTGRRIAQPVQLVDVMPTILEVAGIDTSGLLVHGESLLPLVRGETPEYWDDRIILSEEVMRYGGRDDSALWGSIFFRNWHVLRSKPLEDTLIFDYVADPGEGEPLAGGFRRNRIERPAADLLQEIKETDIAIWRTITRGGGEQAIQYDPDAQKQLRSLGYIE